ncbi:DUF721 domain-containing protein [Boudabousia liubingyangii]|uniref:DUF721 domain-containing protein n=1 Tax=Boudabousia liubingyangii TaxID=1921764 RepID=UPI000A5088A8|nr:DciA family protein [Boudabousia liubingyangii]
MSETEADPQDSDYPLQAFQRARQEAFAGGALSSPLSELKGNLERSTYTEQSPAEFLRAEAAKIDSRILGYSAGVGLPRVMSGPGPSARDPQKVGPMFSGIFNGREKELSAASIMTNWAEMVGPQIAEHAEIESFKDGKLIIRASSTAWAQQLKLLIPNIMRKIGAAQAGVKQLIILPPKGPNWKKGPLSVPGRGPRDTYG